MDNLSLLRNKIRRVEIEPLLIRWRDACVLVGSIGTVSSPGYLRVKLTLFW